MALLEICKKPLWWLKQLRVLNTKGFVTATRLHRQTSNVAAAAAAAFVACVACVVVLSRERSPSSLGRGRLLFPRFYHAISLQTHIYDAHAALVVAVACVTLSVCVRRRRYVPPPPPPPAPPQVVCSARNQRRNSFTTKTNKEKKKQRWRRKMKDAQHEAYKHTHMCARVRVYMRRK